MPNALCRDLTDSDRAILRFVFSEPHPYDPRRHGTRHGELVIVSELPASCWPGCHTSRLGLAGQLESRFADKSSVDDPQGAHHSQSLTLPTPVVDARRKLCKSIGNL